MDTILLRSMLTNEHSLFNIVVFFVFLMNKALCVLNTVFVLCVHFLHMIVIILCPTAYLDKVKSKSNAYTLKNQKTYINYFTVKNQKQRNQMRIQ